LKDLISNVASTYHGEDSLDGFRVYQKENINEALITGLEGGFEFRPVHWFSAFGNMTYTRGDNSTKDEPLSRIPPLFGRIGFDSKVKQVFTWRLELLVAGKQDRLSSGDKSDPRIAEGGTPGWSVLNTRLHYVHRNFRVNAGVQNIFNTA
jgi:outer membrane receptor for ferrienterochelin and colicin